jgi:hypothetical protein
MEGTLFFADRGGQEQTGAYMKSQIEYARAGVITEQMTTIGLNEEIEV